MEQKKAYWRVTDKGVESVLLEPSVLHNSTEWMMSHWFDGAHVFENKSRAEIFYYTRYMLKNYQL